MTVNHTVDFGNVLNISVLLGISSVPRNEDPEIISSRVHYEYHWSTSFSNRNPSRTYRRQATIN